jgi:hypothetical protein
VLCTVCVLETTLTAGAAASVVLNTRGLTLSPSGGAPRVHNTTLTAPARVTVVLTTLWVLSATLALAAALRTLLLRARRS